jgi:DNA polymerase-3 subunit delta
MSGGSARAAAAAALLLVHGEDRYRVDAEVRRWREIAAGAQLGVEVIDPPAPLDRLRSALAEVPLFDDRRYVLVRDPPQLGGGRRAGEGGRELASALELRAPTTSVCLVCHQAVPPSHPVAAAVTRLGGQVLARPPLRGRELRAWAEAAAGTRGLRLGTAGIDHLLRVAGSDLGVLTSELDKLDAYRKGTTGAPDAVPMAVLRDLVAGAEGVEVWNVLERLLGPDPGRGAAAALAMVEEGRSAIYILATVAGQLSELRRVQALQESGVTPAALAGKLGIPDWRADRLARQARAIPPQTVERWLRRLHQLDVAIKTGEADDRGGIGGFALEAARTVRSARTR